MRRPVPVLLLALALPACDAPKPPTEEPGFVDADGDGLHAAADCDDGDADVYPGAAERCDGVDQDCDGLVDEDAIDTRAAYTDADGDGWGVGEAVVTCDTAGRALHDGDCDDADPYAHPEAFDTVGDGADQDCDGYDDGCNADPVLYESAVWIKAGDAAATMAALCASYTGITGGLRLTGPTGDAEIDASCLCEVGGDVVIEDTEDLESFTLGGHVSGDLLVRGNTDLARVTIGGGVYGSARVEDNPVLTEVDARLAEGASLALHRNAALLSGPDCDALGMGDVSVIGNDALPSWSCDTLDVVGDLEIRGNASLGYVGLYHLYAVSHGALRVRDNAALRTLSAASLGRVDGDVELSNNDAWTGADAQCNEETDGLTALSHVGGSFTATDNDALTALCDQAPEEIGGDLVVEGNAALQTLDLPSALDVDGDLVLRDLPQLQDAYNRTADEGEALAVTVGGDLVVDEAGEDLAVGGDLRSAVTSIGGDLRLVGRAPARWTLGDIGGDVEIVGAPEGRDLTVGTIGGGVDAVGVTGGLRVDTTDIGGDIDLVGVDRIELPSLVALAGTIDVEGGPPAADGPCDFPMLAELGGLDLSYDGDADLDGCFLVLSSLGGLSVDGEGLVRVPALPSLTRIDGSVWIAYTTALTDLSGLAALQEVGGAVYLRDNAALTTLDGLDALRTVGGQLSIFRNAALTDLTALHGVTSVGGDLSVYGNAALAQADAEALAAAIGSVAGTVYVEDNGP